MSKASQYSELATGMYGSSMIYGVMGEIDSPDDVKRLLNGKKDREGYKQAFLDHAHLAADAILYTNWGCEDCQSLALTTASGVEITAPPYFLVRHDATRSIVLCVRGTWNIKDFITDFKCCGVAWERGKAHEGIALVVDSLLEDEELNEAIAAALAANPDYRMVAVGHSLGAGIAALLTIRWRALKRFNNPVCFAIAAVSERVRAGQGRGVRVQLRERGRRGATPVEGRHHELLEADRGKLPQEARVVPQGEEEREGVVHVDVRE